MHAFRAGTQDFAAGPQLLDEPGVGPVVAAQLLISWSHHGRVRNEAAFASLAGVAPLETSSGQRSRHRRTAEGKTHRDIRRSLKRALARRLYRRIEAAVRLNADRAAA